MYSLVVVEIIAAVLAAPRNQLHLVLGVVAGAMAVRPVVLVLRGAAEGEVAVVLVALEVLVVAVAVLVA